MFNFFPRLKSTKTLWIAILAILGAIAAYQAGTITLAAAIQIIVTALLSLTIRDGVAKAQKTLTFYANRKIP